MDIKISIVVPVYNVEDYLQQCLDSLENQTFKDFEVITINDGSKDNSLEILKINKNKFKNYRIINQQNSGLSAARNAGINIAVGEYIMFLDSDDMLEKDALETIYKLIKQQNLDLVTFDMMNFNDSKEKIQYKKEGRDEVYSKDIMTAQEYLKGAQKKTLLASTLQCFRLNFLKENNLSFKVGILHEDEDFTMKAYEKIENVGYINRCLYRRRFRNESIMNNNRYSNKKSLNSYFIVLDEFKKLSLKNNSQEFKELIKIRSTLILSNLIRYKGVRISDLINKSKELNIKLNYLRITANIIVFKFLKK